MPVSIHLTTSEQPIMTFSVPAWPPDWPEIREAVDAAMHSGDWGRYHSQLCAGLERRLAADFGLPLVRLCSSGTAALEIGLRSLGIGDGDEILLAAYDYPGNFRTVELVGARPVLVDIDPNNLSIDPQPLTAALSKHVRAVIATHLYGQPAHIDALRRFCDQHGCLLIEDACQVLGMSLAGRPAGTLGDVAIVSFGGSKLVSAGAGGALLVKSERLAARVGPWMDRPGEVFPMAPLAAAAIGPQLDRLDQCNRLRAETANWLTQQQPSALPAWEVIHRPDPAVAPAHYKLAWLAKDQLHRARIIAAAESAGIPIGAGYRSASRCSPRRCRKPVDTVHAESASERLFVLDQRVLLIQESQREALLSVLQKLHDESLT